MPATLSDLLLSVRMEHAKCAVLQLRDDANIDLPPGNQLLAHFVLDGSVDIIADQQGMVRAGRHDFVLFSRGDGHRLLGATPGRPSEFRALRNLTREDAPTRFELGKKPGVSAVLLSAVFGLERRHRAPLNARMPPFLHLGGGSISLPAMAGEGRSLAEHCAGPGGSAFAVALIYLLFFQTTRFMYGNVGDEDPRHNLKATDISTLHVPAIEATLRLLDRRMDDAWTVAGMASAVGMSRSAFAASFLAITGATPLAYLTALRLREADRLLREAPELGIGEIAHHIGYQSQAAFSRAYRRRYGLAPRQRR